jgi:poly-gamma-glutamate synthesis protein (capsule biosynthesis protein)
MVRAVAATLMVAASATLVAVQLTPSRDQQKALAIGVKDGFTLASVGDLIIAHPIEYASDPDVMGWVKLLRSADAAFGNFEGSAIDIRRFRGSPAAEFGGMWLIGVPEVAKNLKDIGFDLLARANNHTTD